MGPSLIAEWRRKHPGPPLSGRAKLADIAPVTAYRPQTRAEKKRIDALSNIKALAPITYEELCNTSRHVNYWRASILL